MTIKTLPSYELNNEYDIIKNQLTTGKYTTETKKKALLILYSYESLPEQDKDIISPEKIERLNIFLKQYNEEIAAKNEQKRDDELSRTTLLEINKDIKKAEEQIQKTGDNLNISVKTEEKQEIMLLIAIKKRAEATEKIVQKILQENHIYTIRDDENPEMWIYKNGIYKPEGKTYIQEITREILGELHTGHITNEIINKIQADTFIEQEDFFNQQNKYINIIPVQNGLLNIETKKLEEFTPTKVFFNKIQATYNPKQECPNIKKFFNEILKDKSEIQTIQELFGFSLLKDYRYEKSFMFLGTGRNGKGKTIELFKRFLGQENCAGVSLNAIESDKFTVSYLHNKLINISADLSKQALTNTGILKNLTGRDLVSGNRKFRSMINFVNYAKMIFATNELPKSNDLTDGFWLRWILIDFPFKFLPQKEIDDLDDNEKINARLQNPKIIEEITNQNELDGLLNWALEGLERLQKNKDFSYNKTMKQTKETWIRSSDSIKAFIMDNIETDFECMIEKKKFKEAYHHYCKTHKVKPESDKEISNVLTKDYGVTSERPFVDNQQYRVWSGIKFSQGSQDINGFSSSYGILNSYVK